MHEVNVVVGTDISNSLQSSSKISSSPGTLALFKDCSYSYNSLDVSASLKASIQSSNKTAPNVKEARRSPVHLHHKENEQEIDESLDGIDYSDVSASLMTSFQSSNKTAPNVKEARRSPVHSHHNDNEQEIHESLDGIDSSSDWAASSKVSFRSSNITHLLLSMRQGE